MLGVVVGGLVKANIYLGKNIEWYLVQFCLDVLGAWRIALAGPANRDNIMAERLQGVAQMAADESSSSRY
jgi:hypothetical protein